MKRGVLLILSAPAGAGKDTVCEALLEKVPDLSYSVSTTTRPKRDYEIDGKNYFFLTKEEFKERLNAGGFLENVVYAGHYYGTPKAFVEEQLAQGISVILKIEVQGAAQVKASGIDGVFIFLVPPEFKDLQDRLIGRGSESQAEIEERTRIAKKELAVVNMYDYVVVNDTVSEAVNQMEAILLAEKHKRERMLDLEIFQHMAETEEGE
ncbi:MAG: guanylate kinase [Firmicutes bacterium]|jgi:guanylate kinase|nr:guanylate kinase [Bacillota bacterium]